MDVSGKIEVIITNVPVPGSTWIVLEGRLSSETRPVASIVMTVIQTKKTTVSRDRKLCVCMFLRRKIW